MKLLSLNGCWSLEGTATGAWPIPARVPGSVYRDLLEAGAMPDPFYRDNEDQALALMEQDFLYRRSFCVPQDFLDQTHAVLLRAEGLDTVADIWINDQPVGHADNMHRTWEFNVGQVLRAGENQILIRFTSPTQYIRQAYAQDPADGSEVTLVGFPLLRKAHCMFGWDWGPRLPDAGIWRDICLIGVETARIRDVRIEQRHQDGKVTCRVLTHITPYTPQPISAQVEITAPDGQVFSAHGTDCVISIDEPQLWWPNGLGDQPLYRVEVRLTAGAQTVDLWSRRIGLRTMTVHRQSDRWGEGFCHRVNGVDVFAMGADYIPQDSIVSRVTPERIRRLLEDARDAHMNTIRVWGGGCYPDESFYDCCDELGLMVWQDFMFACAVYNLTDHFEENIRREFVDNIRRIRHHPCLALWCGNNEMEDFVAAGAYHCTSRQRSDYIKMYEYILPQVLKQEDPSTFYWPSSASSGGGFDQPNSPDRGDTHYWQVWHGRKPFTDYRSHFFRYASEFGFQSFPCMQTISSFTLPEERNVFSYVMERHQRSIAGNGLICSYLAQTYLYPNRFDLFVYASQLLQAQAMQYGVEHWRRNRGRCMGAVVWQLNDCWPVVSWSSIDYYGRWKALHYYEKRFFAPVLISCHEQGIISQEPDVNALPFDLQKTARLNVSNETRRFFTGTAHWALRRPDASVIREGAFDVSVPPMSALWLPEQDFHDEDTYGCYYSYRLADADGNTVGSGSVLFCPPKHFRFLDPQLQARLEGDEIVVSAHAYARSVEILCGADVVLEDNYFDMDAGQRRVHILRGTPEQPKVRSVYDIR